MPAAKVLVLKKVDLVPGGLMPKDLDKAELAAMESSQSIKIAQMAEDAARDALSTRRWSNMPRANGVYEWSKNSNLGALENDRDEHMVKIEFVYDFNFGLSSVNESRAARRAVTAAEARVTDERRQVREQVRNAWKNLETSRKSAAILREQEKIAEEFLELARKERTLGRRSLLDVLNGESVLIDARSSAASAEAEAEIFMYQLLRAIGLFDIVSEPAVAPTR
jgi:adhesin transport system outer membrane protein